MQSLKNIFINTKNSPTWDFSQPEKLRWPNSEVIYNPDLTWQQPISKHEKEKKNSKEERKKRRKMKKQRSSLKWQQQSSYHACHWCLVLNGSQMGWSKTIYYWAIFVGVSENQPLPIWDSKMTVHATRLPLQIQKMKCAWNSKTFKLGLTPFLKWLIILAENYWLLVVGTVCTSRDLRIVIQCGFGQIQ